MAWLSLGTTFTSFRGTSPALGSPHGCMKGSHMKNVSTGAGLCVLGLCIVGYPLVNRISTRAEAGVPAAGAVAAAALAQDPPAPKVVWYGVTRATYFNNDHQVVFRAWSDGRLEATMGRMVCGANGPAWDVFGGYDACRDWTPVGNNPQGIVSASDLNGDGAVDGNDLGRLLANWGPIGAGAFPQSDCPLALINP